MKMQSRKLQMIMAMLVLALVFVAACNRIGDETTPAIATDPYGLPQEEAPAQRGHEPRDLGGITMLVGCWWDNALPSSAMGWDEPDPATSGNYYQDRLIWENAQRVRREFNVEFENATLDHGAMVDVLTSSVMAGSAFADVVMLGGGMILSAIMGDLIMPLDEINLPNSDILGPQLYGLTLVEFRGDRWSFMCTRPYLNAMLMGVNLDIINAIGAPNPADLYTQGRWTWEAALNIMRMATRDTTGDGTIDQFGLAGQPGDIMFLFIGSNDGRLVTDDLQYYLDHSNTVEALEFMETIFREGLWEYDRAHGFDVGDWGRNFWAFHEGNSALFPATTWAMNDGDLPFDFIGVPFPLGPSNTSGNSTIGGWRQSFVIPHSTAWDPVDTLMVIEELFIWPGDEPDLKPDGELGWPRAVWLTEDCVQNQARAGRMMNQCIGMVVPQYNWIFGSFVNHFANQEMTVFQAIEHHRPPQQELLDNFFR